MLFSILLVACGQDKESESGKKSDNADRAAEETKDESFKVDKGLLNVEVTIPASLFEDQEIDSVNTEVKKRKD